jgi:beta-lactamase regulating signal transducer with metallopeptidase domain
MNDFANVLFWCALQVSLLAAAALAITFAAARRGPAAGALAAFSGLLAVIGLSLAAFSPWPNWIIPSAAHQPNSPFIKMQWTKPRAATRRPTPLPPGKLGKPDDHAIAAITNADAVHKTDSETAGVAENKLKAETRVANSSQAGPTASQQLKTEYRPMPDRGDELYGSPHEARTNAEEANSILAFVVGLDWRRIAIVGYLAGVSLMLLRILWGALAVRAYRRGSVPLDDPGLRELADVACAELECPRDVEFRVASELSTPATIGWRRPVILLPTHWRDWTYEERRAVIAHEIAHVGRNDFLSWLIAQFGVALHFYHPLVHWLAWRLRLQQELSADAAAAGLVGGQRTYVAILAAMTLRQTDSRIAWPARAFLPTSKTFLRRIEMLRGAKALVAKNSRSLRIMCVGLVFAAASLAAGVRFPRPSFAEPPRIVTIAQAQPFDAQTKGSAANKDAKEVPPTPINPNGLYLGGTRTRDPQYDAVKKKELPLNQVIDLSYIPRDAVLVAVLRPRGGSGQAAATPVATVLDREAEFPRLVGLPLDRIESATAIALMTNPSPAPLNGLGPVPSLHAMILRVADRDETRKVIAHLFPEPSQVEYGGRSYWVARNPADPKSTKPWSLFGSVSHPGRLCCFSDGDRTLVIAADEPFLRRMIAAGAEGASKTAWGSAPIAEVGYVADNPSKRGLGPYVPLDQLGVLAGWAFCVVAPVEKIQRDAQDWFQMEKRGLPSELAGIASAWKLLFSVPGSPEVALISGRIHNGMQILGSFRAHERRNDSDAVFRKADGRHLSWSPSAPVDGVRRGQGFADEWRSDLSRWRDQFSQRSDRGAAASLVALDAADSLLDSVRVASHGHFSTYTAELDPDALKKLEPLFTQRAVVSPQTGYKDAVPEPIVTDRRQNLKQLGLAMHNYHDVHHHFPPAVVIGPDGKTPHSWRVELLPFLVASPKKANVTYRMNEPWDSPANKKVLEQMPDVFRSPLADPKSTNSSYFVFVGPGTPFEGGAGIKIREITDGTSNTLMIVESKRDIPWTKPEDIPFDPNGPPPELREFKPGEFAAAFCDGAVRILHNREVKDQLKWLIERNDRYPVTLPE